MPYIPHTPDDVRAMLDRIGVGSIDALFDEIPPALTVSALPGVPEALTEMEVSRLAAAGFRSRDIGAQLGISPGTVKLHLHSIYSKLDITSRVELANLSQRLQLDQDGST